MNTGRLLIGLISFSLVLTGGRIYIHACSVSSEHADPSHHCSWGRLSRLEVCPELVLLSHSSLLTAPRYHSALLPSLTSAPDPGPGGQEDQGAGQESQEVTGGGVQEEIVWFPAHTPPHCLAGTQLGLDSCLTSHFTQQITNNFIT